MLILFSVISSSSDTDSLIVDMSAFCHPISLSNPILLSISLAVITYKICLIILPTCSILMTLIG